METEKEKNNQLDTKFSNIILSLFNKEKFFVSTKKEGSFYITHLYVDKLKFSGYGMSRVEAKETAMKVAVFHWKNGWFLPIKYEQQISTPTTKTETFDEKESEANIENLMIIINKEILKTVDRLNVPFDKFTMIAAIVMIRNNRYHEGTVITVCTGNKTITGPHIINNKNGLIDCHAEIVARRALVYYLYVKLKNAIETEREDDIFEWLDLSKKYQLKTNVSFYLYVSSSPCGDSRTYTLNDYEGKNVGITDGVLRVKIENGEGTIPTSSFNCEHQALDDIKFNKKLLIMSCSDKLLKYNVLGVQGTLLSYFIEPVYFKGIIIDKEYNHAYCKRAFYSRLLNKLPNLPEPFTLQKISIWNKALKNITFNSTSKYSINWIIGEKYIETILCSTGLPCNGDKTKVYSRLCKLMLFNKFISLISISSKKIQLDELGSYENYKRNVTPYTQARTIFLEAVKKFELNSWITHDVDLCPITVQRT